MFMEGERLRAEFGENTVADLSIGQPLEAPETIVEAFAAASREKFRGRFGYMPNLGYPDVRERAAEDVDFPGITSDSIAMTAGAACAINAAIRTFVDPGDDVIGVAPYFPEFRLYCETASARFVPVPTGPDLRLDLDGISAALSAHTAAVIVNSPCNPSGHVLDGGELSGLASVLEAHNNRHDRKVLLIIDEVYRRLTYPPHQRVEPFNVYEHTVLARSFSKDLGVAGERIGYLVLHPSLATPETHRGLAQALRALGFVNAPATAQRALLHLELVGDQRRPVPGAPGHRHGSSACRRSRRDATRGRSLPLAAQPVAGRVAAHRCAGGASRAPHSGDRLRCAVAPAPLFQRPAPQVDDGDGRARRARDGATLGLTSQAAHLRATAVTRWGDGSPAFQRGRRFRA